MTERFGEQGVPRESEGFSKVADRSGSGVFNPVLLMMASFAALQ